MPAGSSTCGRNGRLSREYMAVQNRRHHKDELENDLWARHDVGFFSLTFVHFWHFLHLNIFDSTHSHTPHFFDTTAETSRFSLVTNVVFFVHLKFSFYFIFVKSFFPRTTSTREGDGRKKLKRGDKRDT